jgi:hypothetical protein
VVFTGRPPVICLCSRHCLALSLRQFCTGGFKDYLALGTPNKRYTLCNVFAASVPSIYPTTAYSNFVKLLSGCCVLPLLSGYLGSVSCCCAACSSDS